MKRTYVSGHLGMVGSAIVRELNKKKIIELLLQQQEMNLI
tara:strand:+ start:366 stop:485 length:120 start_codon:yes stop_codon:yes gene_type:complete